MGMIYSYKLFHSTEKHTHTHTHTHIFQLLCVDIFRNCRFWHFKSIKIHLYHHKLHHYWYIYPTLTKMKLTTIDVSSLFMPLLYGLSISVGENSSFYESDVWFFNHVMYYYIVKNHFNLWNTQKNTDLYLQVPLVSPLGFQWLDRN